MINIIIIISLEDEEETEIKEHGKINEEDSYENSLTDTQISK